MNKIQLDPPKDVIEDHKVWEGFQYKFMLTGDLYNYAPFFEKICYKVCKSALIRGFVLFNVLIFCLEDI